MNLTRLDFVVIIWLNFQRVIQLENDGPGADVEDTLFAVVVVATDVRVLHVVVPVTGVHRVANEK
jgi:hypothetical protein